jgi:hypothetical protein
MLVDQPAGGKHRAAAVFVVRCGIQKLQLHLGGRKSHPIELEITGLLDLAGGDRYMGDDGPGDVDLPDTHGGDAVPGNARRVDQALADREGPDRRRQVAAIAAPVDERRVDGHLAELVVDIVPGLLAAREDHRLAGAGGRAAHAIDLLGIGVRAADHPQQQGIASRARTLCRRGQIVELEENALAGPASHIRGGDTELRWLSHGLVCPVS